MFLGVFVRFLVGMVCMLCIRMDFLVCFVGLFVE